MSQEKHLKIREINLLLARTPLTGPPLPYPAALIATEATVPKVAADVPMAETTAAAAGLEPKGIGYMLSNTAHKSGPWAEIERTSPTES